MPGLTELHGRPSYSGRANFSYVSLEIASKRLHARQGNSPSRGTMSTGLRHPSRRAIPLPCKRFVARVTPANRGEKITKKELKQRYIPMQLLTLTPSNDYT